MHTVRRVSSQIPLCLQTLKIARLKCGCSTTAACVVGSHHRVLTVQSHSWFQRRHCSADVIAPPPVEGESKEYAPKIQNLVHDISQLTLMEVADLNDLLKKTLKITDTPMMAMGAGQAASNQADEEEEAPKQEKTMFTVKLLNFDPAKKVALIKEIKALLPGTNLVQAKKFVESLPQSVKGDISKEESEQLKSALEAVGGTAEVE